MDEPQISRVGIVGAGTMGSKIALFCIISGKDVSLFDTSAPALERAAALTRDRIAERVTDGRMTEDQAQKALSQLHLCATLRACVAEVDLVIETVPERLEIKRLVFAQIDRLAPPAVLVATNSSCIPCSRIADATGRPEKVFNMNFSDPHLVELMGSAQTARETIAAAERFVQSIGMVPIVTKREIMGFSFNRTWRAIKREALHLADGGYIDVEDYDRAWLLEFGTPWGPFGLMDMIGLDVVRDIEMLYYMESKDERDKPPRLLDDLIAQGRLGVKSGRGFYSYPKPAYQEPGWLRKEPPWTPTTPEGERYSP